MIDRKALWISGFVAFALFAATLWRLSLLPDWHHIPADGPANPRTISLFWLLWTPGMLLFTMTFMCARRWLASGTDEAMRAWGRYSGRMLVCYSLLLLLMQAFILARSLGLALAMDRLATARVIFALAGIMMMALGNALPKMPFLAARFRPFRLDPWQWNRHLRFAGKLLVAMGLFLLLVLPLLPVTMIRPATTAIWVAILVASLWYRIKLKREPSPLA